MMFITSITSIIYLLTILTQPNGFFSEPTLPTFIGYLVLVCILSIVGHIVIAVTSKDANAKRDERESTIFDKAENYASRMFIVGVIVSLLGYLIFTNGALLFYLVLGSLMLSQLFEYIFQVYMLRN